MKKIITMLIFAFPITFLFSDQNLWKEFQVNIKQDEAEINYNNSLNHLEPSSGELFQTGMYLVMYSEIFSLDNDKSWAVIIAMNKEKTKSMIYYYSKLHATNSISKAGLAEYNKWLNSPSLKKEISLETAQGIYKAWVNELFEVRYSKITTGDAGTTDGVIHKFNAFIYGRGYLMGRANNFPANEAPPKWLVEMANLLKVICQENDDLKIKQYEVKIKELSQKTLQYLKENGLRETNNKAVDVKESKPPPPPSD